MFEREVIAFVAARRTRNVSLDIAPRQKHFVDRRHRRDQILPSHVAESLSRGLTIIPLYAENSVDDRPGLLLSRPVAFSLDARSTLRRSLGVATELRTTLSRMLRILKAERECITEDKARTCRELADNLSCIVESTRDAFSHIHSTAEAVSQDMARHVRQSAITSVPRWIKAARIGSICVSLPAFAAAVLSAVWNTTHPLLALIMALVSATAAMCGGVGPCIAQWCWEMTDKSPPRADIQAVRIETYRLCHPLSLLVEWWLKLAAMLYWFTKLTEGRRTTHVMQELVSIKEYLDQYLQEMQDILSSIESATGKLGDVENMV